MALRAQKTGARRHAVQKPREAVNWSLRFKQLASLLVLTGLIAGTVYLHHDETLPVLHVTVAGDLRYTDRDELVRTVSPFVTGSFMSVDVAGLRRAGEALPWVDQIQVRRVWPDTVHLVVQEHQAFARWNETDLVNNRGQVFTPTADTMPQGLVRLYGPEGSSEMMSRRLVDIQRRVNALDLRVSSLHMDERRSWQVAFTDDLKLRLGRANSESRLNRFIRVFNGPLAIYREQVEAVDMRYTNGLAVRWKGGQQPNFNGTL